ncbi:hypothetical protein LAZ67_11003481 [Cordylochernes scorpioides]|uniref:Uncharacterized protein n=1 Tax=Cordylochernes scorpioides TaxID=51811 RepID=A0ABY6KZU7_9ARAC|nr:hypothetical protein LAZ67_11003481 [Cordylochernes scorpioides]
MSPKEKAAWVAFKEVVSKFLGNYKNPDHKQIIMNNMYKFQTLVKNRMKGSMKTSNICRANIMEDGIRTPTTCLDGISLYTGKYGWIVNNDSMVLCYDPLLESVTSHVGCCHSNASFLPDIT